MVSQPEGDNPVPGLPKEWGRIVIPDDASELDEVARQVRHELYAEEDEMRHEHRLPFIVLAATVVITLMSLFLVPWLSQVGQSDLPQPQPTSQQPAVSSSDSPSQAPSDSAVESASQ